VVLLQMNQFWYEHQKSFLLDLKSNSQGSATVYFRILQVYGEPSGPSFREPVLDWATSPLMEMSMMIAREVRTYVQTLVLNRAVISIFDAGVL
jgi:hypothetical protein